MRLAIFIGLAALVSALLYTSPGVYAQQPADFDRDYDGYLDRYELGQYLEEEDPKDLRGGLYLEPELVRPYVAERYPRDGEKVIEY